MHHEGGRLGGRTTSFSQNWERMVQKMKKEVAKNKKTG